MGMYLSACFLFVRIGIFLTKKVIVFILKSNQNTKYREWKDTETTTEKEQFKYEGKPIRITLIFQWRN